MFFPTDQTILLQFDFCVLLLHSFTAQMSIWRETSSSLPWLSWSLQQQQIAFQIFSRSAERFRAMVSPNRILLVLFWHMEAEAERFHQQCLSLLRRSSQSSQVQVNIPSKKHPSSCLIYAKNFLEEPYWLIAWQTSHAAFASQGYRPIG